FSLPPLSPTPNLDTLLGRYGSPTYVVLGGNLRSMTPAVLVLPLPRDNKPLARMWKDKQEQDLRCSRLWTAENVLTSPVVVE
ncbi:hypothetical protein MCOR03_011451, partial [Pyricularia oryzae]